MILADLRVLNIGHCSNLLQCVIRVFITITNHLKAAKTTTDLTRFNKITIQEKCPDSKWIRKPLAYREYNIFNLCVIRPPDDTKQQPL